MADSIRIQKAIAAAGLMSRRAAEDMIRQGRVSVDGATANLGDRVDVESQTVELDGAPIPVNPDLETHLLYKPSGVISSAADPEGRLTVVDLVDSSVRLYPVGRLDYDSEGLILLTNDGELANRVTHPRYGILKTYVALVEGRPGKRDIRSLLDGVDLDDGQARAVSARVVGREGSSTRVVGRRRELTLIELSLGEGRNREVRRMFEALQYPVRRLVRTAIGPISDRSLKPGESRRLSPGEIRDLLASGSPEGR
ncbi:MAG TPA: pseudouridine synthase [Acidimicrobiia bacterium]|nr:pseudouridine synthase [Acidimicrobiia bacterium]